MSDSHFAIVLTDEGEQMLGPLMHLFETKRLTKDADRPIVLVCQKIDFGGPFIEALVCLEKHPALTQALWLPHYAVRFAFDFSAAKPIGFLPG